MDANHSGSEFWTWVDARVMRTTISKASASAASNELASTERNSHRRRSTFRTISTLLKTRGSRNKGPASWTRASSP